MWCSQLGYIKMTASNLSLLQLRMWLEHTALGPVMLAPMEMLQWTNDCIAALVQILQRKLKCLDNWVIKEHLFEVVSALYHICCILPNSCFLFNSGTKATFEPRGELIGMEGDEVKDLCTLIFCMHTVFFISTFPKHRIFGYFSILCYFRGNTVSSINALQLYFYSYFLFSLGFPLCVCVF